jgi:DNA-binding response OmpR family regulator
MAMARIVMIDDNAADTSLLRMVLDEQPEKYDFKVLQTGEDALRFIEEQDEVANEPEPCVIILDLHLPRFDGLYLLQTIRQSTELNHVQVIVLSGFASPAERETISSLGAVYMQKPFQLTEFFELGQKIVALCANPALVEQLR